MKWMESAVCAEIGVEVFFPVKGDTKTSHRAKAICRTCPVITDCLEHVLSLPLAGGFHPLGVWGGTTEAERRLLRRQAS